MNKETGGPAFPVSALVYNDDGGDPTTIIHDGMTLRDYFAAEAMKGMLSENSGIRYPTDELVKFAYDVADEMLKAREL